MIDFENLSLPSLKKYRTQFQIRIKPSVPKSELAAAIAEHFASIPAPEENEVIDQFLRALQKNKNPQSETEESSDELTNTIMTTMIKKSTDTKKKNRKIANISNINNSNINNNESGTETEVPKNSIQSNLKKTVKRNSVAKAESKDS